MEFALREIGRTGIQVTPLAMGCWPIAGITSINVTEQDSLATLQAAADCGLNFFDTAYCYGYHGESESMIAKVLGPRRDQLVIATKGGIHYEGSVQAKDARPATLFRECDESLRRLQTDRIDLYYLHAPDPKTPLAESAGAFRKLLESGKIRSVGVSNFTRDQLVEFHAVCPISAYQPLYNMLQREIEASQLPWCVENGVSVIVYWPLMKGLLAGQLDRRFEFDPKDGRRKYPMFSGEEWEQNQDFIDRLRPIAVDCGKSVAQVVLNWTIQRPGITVALCGAKRTEQIRDNAGTLDWKLTTGQIDQINQAIVDRGPIVSRSAV
ncbi:aldo/keto reductase [Schlesneria paludicola]|uniref:aldo/keto reductase n=1 Tax=Schlesneria paludicola TaxID=360056 RepID=UPI00029A22B6|nr:aldo/keto reductase [Schlesneria paludicola]